MKSDNPGDAGLLIRLPAPVIRLLRRRDANVFFLFFCTHRRDHLFFDPVTVFL